MKYELIDSTIEAFLWTGGEDQFDDPEWATEAMKEGRMAIAHRPKLCLKIFNEDDVPGEPDTVLPGDYICKGYRDRLFSMPVSEFEKTYKEIKSPPDTPTPPASAGLPVWPGETNAFDGCP